MQTFTRKGKTVELSRVSSTRWEYLISDGGDVAWERGVTGSKCKAIRQALRDVRQFDQIVTSVRRT